MGGLAWTIKSRNALSHSTHIEIARKRSWMLNSRYTDTKKPGVNATEPGVNDTEPGNPHATIATRSPSS
jgi:hypothetical protein